MEVGDSLSAHNLPPEIMHQIAALHLEDSCTLSKMGRISRIWYKIVEPLLYSSIRIIFDPLGAHRQANALLRLLYALAQNLHLGQYVHRLEVIVHRESESDKKCPRCGAGKGIRCYKRMRVQKFNGLVSMARIQRIGRHGSQKAFNPPVLSVEQLHTLCAWSVFQCPSVQSENDTILEAHLALAIMNLPNLKHLILPQHLMTRRLEMEVLDAVSRATTSIQCLQVPVVMLNTRIRRWDHRFEIDSTFEALAQGLSHLDCDSQIQPGIWQRRLLIIRYSDILVLWLEILKWLGFQGVSTLVRQMTPASGFPMGRTVAALGFYQNPEQYIADIRTWFHAIAETKTTFEHLVIHLHINQLIQLAALIDAITPEYREMVLTLDLNFVQPPGVDAEILPWQVNALSFMLPLGLMRNIRTLSITDAPGTHARDSLNFGIQECLSAAREAGLTEMLNLRLFDLQ
ncbi:hypothetical protein BKA62DRAFT_719368 [Auriculariales sp. MPI-PUGE-AT-0066]|nr:hypothetical protein BKA62DRAFT_719368 [Auriculariales sp. MPI-PUGE-AT-0066]